MRKLERLTPEQEAYIPILRKEWKGLRNMSVEDIAQLMEEYEGIC